MNEQYTTVSTTANVIQAVANVLNKLNPEYVEVPHDPQEMMNDIQAFASRMIGGNRVN